MTEAAASPGTTQSPMLAGLSAAGRVIPVSLFAALPGLVFLAGYDHLAYGLGLLAGVVLAGMMIAPQIARSGSVTIVEALLDRFGRTTAMLGGIVIVLVVLPLLVAEFALVGILAETGLGMPYLAAILSALGITALASALLGARSFGWLAAAAYAIFAAALLVPLVLMASNAHGLMVPHIDYGRALVTIGELEEQLLENGLVDFETFGAHVAPFLRLTQLDLFALVVSLALGTAVLPQLVSALAGRRPAATRLAGAWTALFVMIALISVPALAAYAKLGIYGAMTASTPLANLPHWLEAPLRADLAHIHGTSLFLLNEVVEAVRAGSDNAGAVAEALAAKITPAAQWAALDAQVQDAMLMSARRLIDEPQAVSDWQTYLATVLPAAAAAAGNEAATLTQASLVIEPAGLLLALPGLTGVPDQTAGLIAVGGIALALVMLTALARSLLALSPEPASPRQWPMLVLALGTTSIAAGFAALRPGDLVTVVVSALSLGAAGLFPVLAVGLAWKRAGAAAATAAILVGAGVTLYYDIGIQVFPTAFYKTWQGLSDAGEMAIEEFNAREAAWSEAEDGEAKATAAAARDDWARGTAMRPGLANWAGIDSAAGAIFGVPAGLLTLALVSLVTRTRRTRIGGSQP